MARYIAQKIISGNDTYGNPRRLFIVYDSRGISRKKIDSCLEIVGVFDVGYDGINAIPEKIRRDMVWLSPIRKVPVSEYHSWLRYWKDVEEERNKKNK